ncbi:MAG: prepilin-type N-terminal cleavage/methylation domain-containing protein [Gemmatimonadetes bacterium]|nr:prepilin-type N-terminal cleavage/methylation domain-containing protein [Gemmatimonadota bacterium]
MIAARGRRGFTLWETALVLAVLGVTLGLTAQALVSFGTEKPRTDAEALLTLLKQARAQAIRGNTAVALRIDPVSGRFRMDTTGALGSGEYLSGTIELGGGTGLETEQARLQFLFNPAGAAFADSVGVRGAAGTVMVLVDPWSGVARAEPR